jgi:hypothetical protein
MSARTEIKPGRHVLLGAVGVCPSRRPDRPTGNVYDLDSGGGAAG